MPRREMRQHLSAIKSTPIESHMRKAICVAPNNLIGDESIQSGLGNNLRKACGESKCIWQIQKSLWCRRSKLFFPPTCSMRDLANETLTTRCGAIGLDPHCAVGFPLASFHCCANAIKEFRAFLFDILILLRLTAEKSKVRKTFNISQRCRKRAHAFTSSLVNAPKPRGIDMCVTNGDACCGAFAARSTFQQSIERAALRENILTRCTSRRNRANDCVESFVNVIRARMLGVATRKHSAQPIESLAELPDCFVDRHNFCALKPARFRFTPARALFWLIPPKRCGSEGKIARRFNP